MNFSNVNLESVHSLDDEYTDVTSDLHELSTIQSYTIELSEELDADPTGDDEPNVVAQNLQRSRRENYFGWFFIYTFII